MLAGGISEAIMHFVGYFKIIDDIARDRIEYDGSAIGVTPEDYIAKHPTFQAKLDADDIEIRGVRSPPAIGVDHSDADAYPLWLRKAPAIKSPASDDDGAPQIPLPRAGGGGGGGGGGTAEITVSYQSEAGQSLIDIYQINVMSNNDIIGLDAQTASLLASRIEAINVDAVSAIEDMADAANASIPQEWWIAKSSLGVVEFLEDHDQAVVAAGGAPSQNSVQPGYYLNGELQDPSPEAPYMNELPEPPESPDHGDGIGQWAELGSNFSLNAALILDLTEAGRTMVVKGDFHHTDAIFQTNSLANHDNIAAGDGSGMPAIPVVSETDDAMNNVADFVQLPGLHAEFPAYLAGPNWTVDVVDGDFYDVRVVTQTNYLSDNDVVAQRSSSSHYEIRAGGNILENLASILDGAEIKYDLIIVGGAYHGMNVIFQNNILLSENDLKMIADSIGASRSIESGGNNLLNQATIENYGGDEFAPINDDIGKVIDAVAGGATSLDPVYGSYFDGSGGPIHVLYVTGDYYDVNAIWQTNVTSDVNVMAQLVGVPPEGLAEALAQDGSTSQTAVVGHNSLFNDATIIDVGPTNTYVGGDVYSDAILVQANLLPEAQGGTLDTQALVPELVAFVTDSQEASQTEPAPNSCVPVTHDDPIASVMH
jgi:hypothetical protein